jgi:protein transport protein SEC31
MKIKEIERTVNVSWSPAAQHPILLAAGTAAQQLDASFSTTAMLEIYALNLTEPGLDMELRTSVPSDFRCVSVVNYLIPLPWGLMSCCSHASHHCNTCCIY